MNDNEITAFIKVVQKGSFAGASKELFCSSVSVMNQINALESDINVPLFDRTNHGVRLTAAGRAFYEDMVRIRGQMDSAIQNAQSISASGKKVIRIGTSILRPCRELINLWERMSLNRDDFQIVIVPFNDDTRTLQSVLSEKTGIDFFAAPCDPVVWHRKYNICLLDKMPCRIAMSRRHPLASRKKLRWSDIRNENLILVREGLSSALGPMRRDIVKNHPGIHIVDTESMYTMETFNLCEQMNCLMESLDMWKDVHPALVTLPMEWDYRTPYGIIFPRKPSPDVQEFIDILDLPLI